MAFYEERVWESNSAGGLSRRDRKGGAYRAYVPDGLVGRTFSFGGEVAADIADAERAIVTLNASTAALVDTEALARLLLRAESVASSRIEGLIVGAKRLLEADAAAQAGGAMQDVTAAEVLANIDAMAYATHAVETGGVVTLDALVEGHRRLLAPTALSEAYGGKIRTEQNWIGGSSFNPCSAVYVPPPPEFVEDLLQDLCAFCNDDSLPAVAQAAIAHAQFESIHPFADGNGRVGRALIHMVLRRRGLTTKISPPVSLILATRADDYVAGLQATRYVGAPDSPDSRAGLDRWLGTFAASCSRSVAEALAFEVRIGEIQDDWRRRLGAIRSDATALAIIAALPGAPIVTTTSIRAMTGRSHPVVTDAIARLVEVGVLTPSRPGRKRMQVYAANDLIAAFTSLERRLASPDGDTEMSPPNRKVPSR